MTNDRTAKIVARIRRWWYLLRVGMWRGEVGVDFYDETGPVVIGSGKEIMVGIYESYRIWWERK